MSKKKSRHRSQRGGSNKVESDSDLVYNNAMARAMDGDVELLRHLIGAGEECTAELKNAMALAANVIEVSSYRKVIAEYGDADLLRLLIQNRAK